MSSFFDSLKVEARQVRDEIQYDPHDPDAAIQSVIDRRGSDGFQWRVWGVAASGFFTTSYSIFAVNVISPALTYVYPQKDCSPGSPGSSLVINLTTLIGTVVGAIVFGFLADRYGRKSVYGLELSIVVVATIGTSYGISTSPGYGSMNVYGWIVFWRILLGVGLGAEYPLSAIIAAEWSSTKSRGRIMAAVFLMQSVGQLAAYGFGLVVLVGLGARLGLSPDETNWEVAAPKIDAIWRVIIGVGGFPALLALGLRRIIPETPYYLVEAGRVTDAITAAGRVYAPESNLQPMGNDQISPVQTMSDRPAETSKKHKEGRWNTTEYIRDVREYLSQKSRWRTLLAVMLAWWLLDLAYYGLGLDNPKTISAIWLSSPPNINSTSQCVADPTQQHVKIYEMLHGNIVRNLITISTGTLPGSIIILLAIDYVPRVTWMMWTFITLAALFAVNGGTLFVAFESDEHLVTIVFYVLAQLIFNLGPNTMTFILPAELFGTKFRGTFYGLAAASGKIGAITILLIINFGVYEGEMFLRSGKKLAGTLLGFVPAMLLGAFITWVWIPEVQFARGHGGEMVRDDNISDNGSGEDQEVITFREKLKLPNRPLAHIAQDPEGGQVLGVRRNLSRLIHRNSGSHKRTITATILESGADKANEAYRTTASPSMPHHLSHPQPVSGHADELNSTNLEMRIPAEGSSTTGQPITTATEPQPSTGGGYGYYGV
ncbi:major facilitator superfamily domain-containing protein [Nemania abortiva]|nr:major facilitator superfamily domain-containing protein [Nemania abortiva]